MLGILVQKKVAAFLDSRSWSLELKYLPASSPMNKEFYAAIQKSKCPKHINILIRVMIIDSLNCSKVLQRTKPSHCISPLVCPLCSENSDVLQIYSLVDHFQGNSGGICSQFLMCIGCFQISSRTTFSISWLTLVWH